MPSPLPLQFANEMFELYFDSKEEMKRQLNMVVSDRWAQGRTCCCCHAFKRASEYI